MSSAYKSREVHLTVKTAPKSPIKLVAVPRIFFRGVIQIRVEQVDKDLFVNNLFIFFILIIMIIMIRSFVSYDTKEDIFLSQHELL